MYLCRYIYIYIYIYISIYTCIGQVIAMQVMGGKAGSTWSGPGVEDRQCAKEQRSLNRSFEGFEPPGGCSPRFQTGARKKPSAEPIARRPGGGPGLNGSIISPLVIGCANQFKARRAGLAAVSELQRWIEALRLVFGFRLRCI